MDSYTGINLYTSNVYSSILLRYDLVPFGIGLRWSPGYSSPLLYPYCVCTMLSPLTSRRRGSVLVVTDGRWWYSLLLHPS